ncbi:MAG: HAD family phosphatase [Lachnospiraceae bacterium]|nr:HAD family phosphatase [Lachnospiraceae bacterium]
MKAIIFDMDGVLVNSEPVYLDFFRRFLLAHGKTPQEDLLLHTVGASNEITWQDMAAMWGEDRDWRWVESFYRANTANQVDYPAVIFPGVKETLAALSAQGWRLLIASASRETSVRRMMRETGLEPYIYDIVSGEMVAHSKPAPDVYLRAIERAGVPAENCLAVEDSAHGIEAAHRAGLTVIGVRSLLLPHAWDAADYRIESVAALPQILDTLWNKQEEV